MASSDLLNDYPLLREFLQGGSLDLTVSSDLYPLIEALLKKEYPASQTNGSHTRWQDDWIVKIIPSHSRILDLGCGEGKLLQRLCQEKPLFAQGVELDYQKALSALEKGVAIFQVDLETGLHIFPDKSFDYVIMEDTLQTLKDASKSLEEMLRIGKLGIVTFPNFGYWKVRLDFLLRGRMPVTEWLPYHWYNTPNIHFFTYEDFLHLLREHDCLVEKGYALSQNNILPLNDKTNWEAEELLLVIRRK